MLKHVEEGSNVEEQRRDILAYFAKVSQKFPALDLNQLEPGTREALKDPKVPKQIPFLDLISVKEALRTAKHTWSQVPGDLPASLRKEFLQ